MIDSKYFEDLQLFREAWIEFTSILTDIQDKEYLEHAFDQNYLNATVELYNSVKGEHTEIKANDLLKDISNNYIIVENGCLFLKHELFTTPAAVSFDILKKLRSYYKGNMKKAKEDGKILDIGFYSLMQQNTKEALNTYYGIMVNILSKYYNYDVAGSTTIRGRSTVSMNGLTVEYIFGKYRPYNVSIHLHFINCVINKAIDWDYWSEWFKEVPVPTTEEIIKKLLLHHLDRPYYGYDILKNRIDRLTDKEKYLVYYTGSFALSLKIPKIKELILDIMKTQNDDYDKVEKILNGEGELKNLKKILYLDPMKGPEKLTEHFNILNRYFTDIMYGYYWYEGDVNEYGERLDSTEFIFKSIQRDRIIVTDTDSLIIYLDADMDLIKAIDGFKEVTNRFGTEMLEYVVGSFIINAISTIVQQGLVRYTRMSNIHPNFGKEINYKQEYFFCTLQPTKGAKNYMGYIGIQEGVFLPTKEIDLKGLSLKKSNFNPTISARAKELVLELIAKKEDPDLRTIFKTIEKDRKELLDMYTSSENIKMFTISKYKKGYDDLYDYEKGNDRIKACLLYNSLYPDKDPIKIPGSFLVASLDFAERDQEVALDWPDKYEKILKFNEERLVTKCKCALRSKIRSLYNIDKTDEITNLNVHDQSILDLMYDIDNINDYEEMTKYVTYLRKETKSKIRNNQTVNENLADLIDKLKVEKNDISEITKIAIPLDSETVDEFISQLLATKDTIVYENLISVITEGLGIVSVRNVSGRATMTNVISYF